ncbi:MAG TPA: DUF192 domain-containing protein [Thermoanaerobaculia bacterium]|nr:DUF192 domain-containing protein [Thermoanaerobaculia bacterium]
MRTLAVLLVALACSRPAPPPAATSPSEVRMPRVVFPDGYSVHVELAIDNATRAQGLMYRDRLRENTGMLFVFPSMSVQSFWMKNTLIPLDMIWIDEERRIVHIKHDVPPCQAEPCPSYDPGVTARYVLEFAGGVARQKGIAEGQTVRFEGLDNFLPR